MIGLTLLLAVQTVQGVTPQGQASINKDVTRGPPDAYLQDDIYDITGQHLCDRKLSDRWKKGFDKLYGRRLEALNRKLVMIFGGGAMARDIIRITSCRTFAGASADASRERNKQYLKRRAAFAEELSAWEKFAIANFRN